MTAAVLERPGSAFDGAAVRSDLRARPDARACSAPLAQPDTAGRVASEARPVGRGRVTLEQRLDAVLQATRTNGSAECPVCAARMTSMHAGAACRSCGARLD